MQFLFVNLFMVGLGTVVMATEPPCIMPVSSTVDWNIFWPMVFHEDGSPYQVGESGAVEVPYGESMIISCGPNYLKKYTSKKSVTAKCKQDGKFLVDGVSLLFEAKELGCDLRFIEEVLVPVDGCPLDKTSVKYGFLNPVDKMSYIIGEACYDTEKGRIIFAHVRLGDWPNAILEVKTKNFLNQRHPESRYKVDFMKLFRLDEFNERLRKTLNVDNVPEFDMDSYLSDELLFNGQLVSTKKLAWNYYVRHEHLDNLKLLKEDISNLNKKADIYVGSSNVAAVKNSEGNYVDIYLDEQRFPVPGFIWIVVKGNTKAVAFAVFNNPMLSEKEVAEKSFCVSKCDQISWLHKLGGESAAYLNGEHGAVICCEYEDFSATVTSLPILDGITGLLT